MKRYFMGCLEAVQNPKGDFVRFDEAEAELARLRAVNAELMEALKNIREGRHDPAIGEEEPELLEDQVWRYQQWVRRDQDCTIDALSRAEQAGKAEGDKNE